jgi:hypothetical protein
MIFLKIIKIGSRWFSVHFLNLVAHHTPVHVVLFY